MDINMIGPAVVLGLGCVGSSIGTGIGGMALHGVMSRTESGHGKFIALTTMTSSQVIYAFILMVVMKTRIENGDVPAVAAIGIAFFAGLGLLVSSVYQGKTIATAIMAAAKQPTVFAKAAMLPLIIESFSIFVFVFSMLLLS